MGMKPSDIQKVVEGAAIIVGVHKLHSVNVSLSDKPDDPNYRQTVKRPVYIFGAIMTKDEFFKFRGLCNALGVWIKIQQRWPFTEKMDGPNDLWEYSITASEMWGAGPLIRAFWPFLLAVGITAAYLAVHGYIRF